MPTLCPLAAGSIMRRGDTLLALRLHFRYTQSNMSSEHLAQLDAALNAGKLTPAAAGNIRTWLSEPHYAEYAPQVAEHIAAGKWKELDDAFWTIIPFGTGGRRG